MSDYRTPLPAMLATTLETSINRLLAMDDDSVSRLKQLNQRHVRLELESLGITLNFTFTAQRVHVNLNEDGEPDTVISGSPAALFAMAVPEDAGSWGTPGSRVKISGDATLARDLERLFSRLDPDWEGQASRLFGDVMGYQLAAGVRGLRGQLRDTLAHIEKTGAGFLQATDSPLAQAEEISSFGHSVDSVRDATERLEARLRVITERIKDAETKPETDQ